MKGLRITGAGLVAATLMAPWAHAAGNVAKGQAVFEDRCTFCHSPEGGGQGPSLAGVVGRKAGALPGFPYTTALKTSGLVWTPSLLETFLSGPSKLVPGTAMAVAVSDPADRQDLIAYLATTSARP